jgi:hypothetical protein
LPKQGEAKEPKLKKQSERNKVQETEFKEIKKQSQERRTSVMTLILFVVVLLMLGSQIPANDHVPFRH